MFPDKIPVQTVKPEIAVTTEKDIKSSKSHFENETKDNTATELPDNLFNQSSKEQNVTSDKDVRVPKSELCTVCRRRAYPMDALTVDKKKYHKSCFCCEHCGNKLSLGNYVSLHGHFYCLHHYKQLLKSKGNYDNGLGFKMKSTMWNTKEKHTLFKESCSK
uniref:LIM zinc-binding domain-containing protein n=1 Tax=Monopterus albus TaxID=43700 RepID=A0A3Q3JN30_MONAL